MCYLKMRLCWIFLFMLISLVHADYPCLCNFNTTLDIFDSASSSASTTGSLYQNDCAELLRGLTTAAGWEAIAHQHKIGYVKPNYYTDFLVCRGDVPDVDKVTMDSSSTTAVLTTVATYETRRVTTSPPTPVSSEPATTTTAVVTTAPPVTTIRTGIVSGQTNLCPAALRSFTSRDNGALAQYDRSCYEMVPISTTWPNAEADCRSKGAHLVQINTQAEQDFIFKWISTKLDRNTWMGLHDIHNESNYQWSTGESAVYYNWLSGQKPQHSTQDCVYINAHNGGYWDDEHCESSGGSFIPMPVRHPYICQYEIDTNTMVHGTVNPDGDGKTQLCPTTVANHATRYHGYLGQYGRSCYELLPRYDVTWSHGETLCKQEGGHLAHISNADEQGFIQDFVEKHMPNHGVWIGLNDRAQEGHYTWSSGAPVTYTNWVKAHSGILDSPSREDCVLFLPFSYGHWNDISCGRSSIFGYAGETHPILCQFSTNQGLGIVG